MQDSESAVHRIEPPKRVFVIGSVRDASPEDRVRMEDYVALLEENGTTVHLPHRDTNQNASGLEICQQNYHAIRGADEVHVFYCSKSQGTHFDLGMAFALGKPIVVTGNEPYGPGKSFAQMIEEWQEFNY